MGDINLIHTQGFHGSYLAHGILFLGADANVSDFHEKDSFPNEMSH